MVYDRFGQGIVDKFDQFGSFGLSTTLTNPAGFEDVSSAPRVTGIHTIPTTDNNGNVIFLPPPVSTFRKRIRKVPLPSGQPRSRPEDAVFVHDRPLGSA